MSESEGAALKTRYHVLDEAITSAKLAANPYPVYEHLRSNHPLIWSHLWHCWVVSRHEDVMSILKDTERFSSVGRVTQGLRDQFPQDQQSQPPHCIFMNPWQAYCPAHTEPDGRKTLLLTIHVS